MLEHGTIDDGASALLLIEQTRLHQKSQVVGERRRGKTYSLLDFAHRQPLGARPNQRQHNREPGLGTDRGKAARGLLEPKCLVAVQCNRVSAHITIFLDISNFVND